MSQVKPEQGTQVVNLAFIKWGLPKVIKIDNGRPFANPMDLDNPTLSVLWWIGLGIDVILNTPGRPQENGTVEGQQGTICRWANPSGCENRNVLNLALREAGRIHRSVYRVRAKGKKTRLDLYPELLTNPRKFSEELFSMERVYKFLAGQVWDRRIRGNGCVKLFGKDTYVGLKYIEYPVTIIFDPLEDQWIVRTQNGTLLNKIPNKHITQTIILDHVKQSKDYGV